MKYANRTIMFLLLLIVTAITPMISLADSDLPIISGEVRKVKPDSGKITIRHEPIPNLDMPSMSMVFRVDEGIDISQFAKGETVEFTVIERDGKMVILSIEKAESK